MTRQAVTFVNSATKQVLDIHTTISKQVASKVTRKLAVADAKVAESATSQLRKSMLDLSGSDHLMDYEGDDIDISRYGMQKLVNIKPDRFYCQSVYHHYVG